MLASALPPLQLVNDRLTENDVAQAYAMVYLASYAHEEIPARVVTAFQRAYGVTNMWRLPRALNLRPNALVVQIPYGWGSHVILAIEGTSNSLQIWTQTILSASAVATTTPPGRVMEFFATMATGISSAWAPIPEVVALFADRRNRITIAGYSLGAGVAEIIASTMQTLAPTRDICLLTFAKPRVGNQEWLTNRPAGLKFRCIYRKGDMMHCLPNNGMRLHTAGPVGIHGLPTFYVADPEAEYWDVAGLGREVIPAATTHDQVRFAAAYLRAVTRESPIYQHVMNSYRHMLCNRLAIHRNLDSERFLLLEYPDDNKWQSAWLFGQVWEPTWIELLNPPPAPIDFTPVQEEQVRMHNAAPQPTVPPRTPVIQHFQPRLSEATPLPQSLQLRRNRHAPAGAN